MFLSLQSAVKFNKVEICQEIGSINLQDPPFQFRLNCCLGHVKVDDLAGARVQCDQMTGAKKVANTCFTHGVTFLEIAQNSTVANLINNLRS